MKRGLIFFVMLVGVLVMGFAQATLSGTYRYSANAYITFRDDKFTGSWNRTSTMSGYYSVSGSILTLYINGGTVGRNTWNWTIVNANTFRDQDGDSWRKEGASSQPPVSWTVNSPSDWIDMVNGIRNAGNTKTHIVTVSGTVSVMPTPRDEYTFGSTTGIEVTIQGDGTITPSSNGSLLRIGRGQTIIVKDLTLKGRDNNNDSVVIIDDDRGSYIINERGSFRMEGGASVSGNSGRGVSVSGTFTMQDNASVSGNIGCGVYVGERGTFIMLDNASVSDNTGGGVYVDRGTFTMLDNASVSGNTASIGGGVDVYGIGGTFTMQGNASVSDNTGGGVYVHGSLTTSFTMQGGTISGNTARETGGGVYVVAPATFTKSGGTIYGNDETDVNLRNSGPVVYYQTLSLNRSNSDKWRNATAGPTMNTDTFGFWLND